MTDQDSDIEILEFPENVGLFLTAEELAVAPVLVGGRCDFTESLGIEQLEDQNAPTFDIGFRSLLARGLVRIVESSVRLSPMVKSVGDALVAPTTAWGAGFGYREGSEAGAFLGVDNGSIALVLGPPGIYSVRALDAAPVDALVEVFERLATSFTEQGASGPREALVFVQQLVPEVSATARVLVDGDGEFSLVDDDGRDSIAVNELAGALEKATSAS